MSTPYTTEPRQTMGRSSVASTYQATAHRRTITIWDSSSDKYLSSQEDVPRNATPGPNRVRRPTEPFENQQPIPNRPWIRPTRRGAAFPKGESSIPYIHEHNQVAISAWFKQNLPPLLCKWDQQVQVPNPNPEQRMGTQSPPTGFEWPRGFHALDHDTWSQETPYPSLPPTSQTAFCSLSTSPSGQQRTTTQTQQSLPPQTTPTPSPIQSGIEGIATSIPSVGITSALSSPTKIERSSVQTERCLGTQAARLRCPGQMAPHPIPPSPYGLLPHHRMGRHAQGKKEKTGKLLRQMDTWHHSPDPCQSRPQPTPAISRKLSTKQGTPQNTSEQARLDADLNALAILEHA